MHSSVKLPIDQSDCLESIFTVDLPKRCHNDVVAVGKHSLPKCQPQPMLEPVGLILRRVEFKLHRRTLCESHIQDNTNQVENG